MLELQVYPGPGNFVAMMDQRLATKPLDHSGSYLLEQSDQNCVYFSQVTASF